jgi:L-ascorbate metabolism protein UlaG (beta-lactamase superfamily)
MKKKKEWIMRTLKVVSAFCVMAILAATYSQAGSDAESNAKKDDDSQSAGAVDSKNALKMLAGIVHFKDNDIRFQTADGINMFVDPTSGPTDNLVVKSGMLKPDLILITHPHADHFLPEVLQDYLKLNPKAILAGPPDVVKLAKDKGIKISGVRVGKDYTLAGISFHTVPAYFKDGNHHPKKNQWVGYVLKLNDASYYVTGDTQPLAEMADIKADVLFPLLSGCGGNMAQAVEMAQQCKAHVVVPVHHSSQEETIKKYLNQLPKGVQGAYFLDAKLIVGP